jgi:hypothetical protein
VSSANIGGEWYTPLCQALGQQDLGSWNAFRREIGVPHFWGGSLPNPCTRSCAKEPLEYEQTCLLTFHCTILF